jgi:hypothetical protein
MYQPNVYRMSSNAPTRKRFRHGNRIDFHLSHALLSIDAFGVGGITEPILCFMVIAVVVVAARHDNDGGSFTI